jgi:hypothetical protein
MNLDRSKPPVRPLRKHAPGGDGFDERTIKPLFDFREKRLQELDDLGWHVMDRIVHRPSSTDATKEADIGPDVWQRGRHRLLGPLVDIDSFVQNAE